MIVHTDKITYSRNGSKELLCQRLSTSTHPNVEATTESHQSSSDHIIIPPNLGPRDTPRIQSQAVGDIGQDQNERCDGDDQILVIRKTIGRRGHIDENGEVAEPIDYRRRHDGNLINAVIL